MAQNHFVGEFAAQGKTVHLFGVARVTVDGNTYSGPGDAKEHTCDCCRVPKKSAELCVDVTIEDAAKSCGSMPCLSQADCADQGSCSVCQAKDSLASLSGPGGASAIPAFCMPNRSSSVGRLKLDDDDSAPTLKCDVHPQRNCPTLRPLQVYPNSSLADCCARCAAFGPTCKAWT
eukprot:SAG22_NODE_146_length_17566_cov_17.597847_8_plen_175_part_00